MQQITVNGNAESIQNDTTVFDLVDRLALTGKRIAIECNGEIVPKSQYANTVFNDGDVVEIVVAVGGG